MQGELEKAQAPEDTGGAEEESTMESAPRTDQEAAGHEPEETEASLEALRLELDEAQSENEALRDQLLRLRAEFDNFRRRTRKEAEDLRRRASADLVRSLLPVVDNLERAIASASGADGAAKNFAEGVDMILKQFLYELEKAGVTPIEAVGAAFDPHVHEAVAHEETDLQPDGHVFEELQKGYLIHGEVLRPSMVKVARAAAQEQGGQSHE